jgi:hypothetical protein
LFAFRRSIGSELQSDVLPLCRQVIVDALDKPLVDRDPDQSGKAWPATTIHSKASRVVFPDQRDELLAKRHSDDAVIVEFNLFGTHKRPMGSFAPTGHSFKCQMVEIFFRK